MGIAYQPRGSQDRILQQEGGPNFALLVNIAPGVALAVDVTDRAGRLLGIVYGDLGQMHQVVPADALAPGNALSIAAFNMVYDPVAGDWNRWIEGATAGVPQVEDTGVNTNPRRYEKDQGFTSAKTQCGILAVNIWAVGLAATYPAAGRTAGQITTIYSFQIENRTAAQIWAWLEIGGVEITARFPVAANNTLTVDIEAGETIGNQDVTFNTSVGAVANVFGVITGTQQ